METLARESMEGSGADDIINRLQTRDEADRARLDEKVWESRIIDAHEKIESLEQENQNLKSTAESEIEELTHAKTQLETNYHRDKKQWEKDIFEREDKLHANEKKIRETERNLDKMLMENEQQVLEAEQHGRSEQRRLQLETEIDHLRRRNEHSLEVIETRETALEKLERELEKV
jgi:hypothetical protein